MVDPRPLVCFLILLLGLPAEARPQKTVVGGAAVSGDRFVTRNERLVTVLGIQAPAMEDDGTVVSHMAAAAQRRLQALVEAQPLHLRFVAGDEQRTGNDIAAHVILPDGRMLAEVMLEEGLVWPDLVSGTLKQEEKLTKAFQRARQAGLGLHARPRPPGRTAVGKLHRGVSMGLYARDEDFDYRPLLDRLKIIHATHLLLITPWFMKDWKSNVMEPVEKRTASFRTIDGVIRQARKRGLFVTLMPIVLLQTGTKDHWRGDIEPASRLVWWRNYARFMGRFALIAEDAGAQMLSVGSEFSSLEAEFGRWRALIRTLRLRFGGSLTYSANWDHFERVSFWGELDLAGMTGYHSLTRKDDPSIAELENVWSGIRKRVIAFQKKIGRPVFFTEVGYASIDGINKNPWNYYISKKPDWKEQADCFRAFISAWKDAPAGFAGAYFYNWWRNENPNDRVNYSIQGKPAEQVISDYYRGLEEASGR